MVSQYNLDSSSLLDRHAPLVKKKIAMRPSCPWYTSKISIARRECRRAERVWRRRRLEIDKQIMVSSRSSLSKLIFDAKTAYLRGMVEEGRLNRRSLFQVLDRNVFKGGAMRLPTHQSRKQLASSFSLFFSREDCHDSL